MQAERIASFVAGRPTSADLLVLVSYDFAGEERELGAWKSDEIENDKPAAARQVTETAQDHADVHGRGKYCLQWAVVADGNRRRIVKRRAFVFAPQEGSAVEETRIDAGQAFDANAPSQAVVFAQAIRHIENMHKMYISSVGSVVQAQRDVITELSKHNSELLRRVRTVQAQALDAEGKTPERDGIEDLARAAAIEKVTDFAIQELGPLMIKKVVSASGGGNSKAAGIGA